MFEIVQGSVKVCTTGMSVVLNTVRESATPGCKENKQADAGSRLFSKVFSVRRVVVVLFIGRAWRSICTCTTGMFSRTLYVQHPVSKNLHISSRFSPTIFYRDANSVLLLEHLCTGEGLYLDVYNGNIQQNPLCVKSCVTKELSISPRFSPTFFFIPMQIQCSYEHT